MPRSISFALVTFIAGVAIGSVALASASSEAIPRTMTLVSVDARSGDQYVDIGPKGESIGDTVVFTELLRDPRRANKVVGHNEILCITVSRIAARCHGTLFLPSGRIEAAGTVRFTRTFRVPIVGGTGSYAAAAGELVITSLSDTRDRYVIRLAA
jgi:allene oxide cyclase